MSVTDTFRIDGHKADWHRDRVQQWLDAEKSGDWELAKKVYPIYIEISPVGGCNHRCTFCAVDYIGYEAKNKLDTPVLERVLGQMAAGGVKSVMWAGEGEPLIHKDLAHVINFTKSVGIDSSMTTNAVLLSEKFCRQALADVTWIKASINGASAESYAKIHQTKARDWDTVWANLERAVKLRSELGAKTHFGVQSLLLPEIWHEIPNLAQRAKDSGVDYLVVKPYSQHKFSDTQTYSLMRYKESDKLDELEKLLATYNTPTFNVVFRRKAMEDYAFDGHHYNVCQATPSFWAYLMADGELYGCSAYLKENLKGGVRDATKDDRFMYGNVLTQSFQEVWEGERRKKSWAFVHNELDITECRKNCRMNQVNKYLTQVKAAGDLGPEPVGPAPDHLNFI